MTAYPILIFNDSYIVLLGLKNMDPEIQMKRAKRYIQTDRLTTRSHRISYKLIKK